MKDELQGVIEDVGVARLATRNDLSDQIERLDRIERTLNELKDAAMEHMADAVIDRVMFGDEQGWTDAELAENPGDIDPMTIVLDGGDELYMEVDDEDGELMIMVEQYTNSAPVSAMMWIDIDDKERLRKIRGWINRVCDAVGVDKEGA